MSAEAEATRAVAVVGVRFEDPVGPGGASLMDLFARGALGPLEVPGDPGEARRALAALLGGPRPARTRPRAPAGGTRRWGELRGFLTADGEDGVAGVAVAEVALTGEPHHHVAFDPRDLDAAAAAARAGLGALGVEADPGLLVVWVAEAVEGA